MSRGRGRPAREYEAEDEAFQEAMSILLSRDPDMTDEEIASALTLGFDDEPEYYYLKRALQQGLITEEEAQAA